MAKNRGKKKGHIRNEDIYIITALIIFNLFFVLQFLFGWIGALIGFIFASIVLAISGLTFFIISVVASFMPGAWISQYMSFGIISPLAISFLSIALVCLGVLWMIGNYYLVKYSYRIIKWYVKLNIKIFKQYGN